MPYYFIPIFITISILYVLLNQVKWQLFMKNKIARQVDHGIKNGLINIQINGKPINNTKELYDVICSKDYPIG